MISRSIFRLWLVVMSGALLVVIGAAPLSTPSDGLENSPLPIAHSATEPAVSPLATPTPSSTAGSSPSSSWGSVGWPLLWTAVGVVLALGVAFIVVRRQRRAE